MGKRGPNANSDHLYKRGNIWCAWFYDLNGGLVRRSTGCTDKKAARARLAEWERIAADPNPQAEQTLNDCLQTLLEDRRANTSAENYRFLLVKAKALVTVFGHDTSTSRFGRDSRRSWEYVDARRLMRVGSGKVVSDRTILRELEVLRMALELAKSRGRWAGDISMVVPDTFAPPAAPKGDSISRGEALRIWPHLTEDTAAAMAFSLATGAELAVLQRATRSDLQIDISTADGILLRGTKNEGRHARIPIVTDEQRVLLEYALRYGRGEDGRLFGNLHRMRKELKSACEAEGIVVISTHDLRRSAGQWMVDLGVPIELVSKFMRHASTSITESVYASVKREDVHGRILDAIAPEYASQAHQAATKRLVETIKVVPEPRTPIRYTYQGYTRTLAEWAKATGIAKSTLHHRLVTRRMEIDEALTSSPRSEPKLRRAEAAWLRAGV